MRTTVFVVFVLSAAVGRAQTPARLGSEIGYGIIQQHCMACHGKADTPQARPIAALRDLAPEKIYAAIATAPSAAHQKLMLSDEQKRRVSESVAGRLLGTGESGDARGMANH